MSFIKLNSNSVLAFFAAIALLAFVLVENSTHNERQKYYDEKLVAATLARDAAKQIKEYRLKNGVFIDAVNDPNETALIGQDITPITTDRGYIDAKLASTNPNFAAVVVEMLQRAGVKENDHVAVAMTGSFPGLNISVLSALEALHVKPIIITSVGASNFGATDPELTWLDMERVLNEAKVFRMRSVAASIGGGSDVGRGLSPEGRGMILSAIKRNNVELINEGRIEASVQKRMKVYGAHSSGAPIKAFVNVGGSIASLGSLVTGEVIPNGLVMELPAKNYPMRGVIVEMAKRGIPIIHLYDIRKLWVEFGLPLNPMPMPELGSGGIFIREKYNITLTWIAVSVLAALTAIAVYLDKKRHKLGVDIVANQTSTSVHEI
ncbi:MAG: poly-gamma-glutamate system protein [Ignavibacteriae bacterium]|nr:poly-gamma-glutamate system protein [Ignavibacteriota bacterium]